MVKQKVKSRSVEFSPVSSSYDDQLRKEYRMLEATLFEKRTIPLRDYINNHTKDDLYRFCQVNYLPVDVHHIRKDELFDCIRAAIITNTWI